MSFLVRFMFILKRAEVGALNHIVYLLPESHGTSLLCFLQMVNYS